MGLEVDRHSPAVNRQPRQHSSETIACPSGRWIAEVDALPGGMCYGRDRDEAKWRRWRYA